MPILSDLDLSLDVLITLGLYAGLGGAYLLVLPGILMYYLKTRWNTMGSVERLLAYALVFVFFPGLLVLSPFVNLRPQPRPLES
jgi:NAD(P)H-quinone oxidoreductase subunit L